MSENKSSNKGLLAILGIFAVAIVAALVAISSQMGKVGDKEEKTELAKSETSVEKMENDAAQTASSSSEMEASYAMTEPAAGGKELSLEQALEKVKHISLEGLKDNDVVATVSGKKITHADVIAFGKNLMGVDVLSDDNLYRTILRELIAIEIFKTDKTLASQSFDKAAQAKLEAQKAMFAFQYLVEQTVAKEMTDEALKAEYNKYKAEIEKEQEVHARHILVEDEAKAREIIAKLEDGEDFATLAKENSTGPSASSGGDLGYFTKEQMVPEFSEAAFAIKKGEFSKNPVKTQFGWHIIKVEDKRNKTAPSFEEMKPALVNQFKQKIAARLKDEIMSNAKITVDVPVKEAETKPADK